MPRIPGKNDVPFFFTDHFDIAEILLKVALTTTIQIQNSLLPLVLLEVHVYIYRSLEDCATLPIKMSFILFVLHRHASTIRYSFSSLVGRFP